MRNRLNLSPKTKTTVGVKRTLVYASIGAGIFVMIFTGAFFYLNMGNSEEGMAGVGNHTVSRTSGDWQLMTTWTSDNGVGKPESNDVITINSDQEVTITDKVDLDNVIIHVYGKLIFTKGKLNLNAASKILFHEGSEVAAIVETGNGNGNGKGNGNNGNGGNAEGQNQITIGNNKYMTSNINSLESPIMLDANSPISGSPIDPTLLPIVLDYFTAAVTASNSVLVEWGTVSEINNDFFTLERSSDGKTFETIATVEGAGNSLKKLQYSFEDKKSTAGMNYYRLKQTDYNGDFEYFKIVGVNNTLGSTQGAASSQKQPIIVSEAYPNPFRSEFNLSFEAESDGSVEIMLQDSKGEIVRKEIVPFYYGINDYNFTNGDQLKPGIYYISLWSNGKKIKTQRLIKI